MNQPTIRKIEAAFKFNIGENVDTIGGHFMDFKVTGRTQIVGKSGDLQNQYNMTAPLSESNDYINVSAVPETCLLKK